MLFTTHELSENDQVLGHILSPPQKLVIQNRMAELATELVNTAHSKADETYFEKINFNKGQIAELQSLLANSETAEQYLNTKEN